MRTLIDEFVEFGSQAFEIDLGRGCESGHRHVRRDKSVALHRIELAHRYAVAGDDERLSPVERPHDLPAVIAQLALSNLTWHSGSVARVLRKVAPVGGHYPGLLGLLFLFLALPRLVLLKVPGELGRQRVA